MDTLVAVPLPCASVCRLDIILNEHKIEKNAKSHIVKWAGGLPAKLPTLLTKIEKSLDNEKLGSSVLKAHFATLQEEWAKYRCTFSTLRVYIKRCAVRHVVTLALNMDICVTVIAASRRWSTRCGDVVTATISLDSCSVWALGRTTRNCWMRGPWDYHLIQRSP